MLAADLILPSAASAQTNLALVPSVSVSTVSRTDLSRAIRLGARVARTHHGGQRARRAPRRVPPVVDANDLRHRLPRTAFHQRRRNADVARCARRMEPPARSIYDADDSSRAPALVQRSTRTRDRRVAWAPRAHPVRLCLRLLARRI